jgi:hypothetical protein
LTIIALNPPRKAVAVREIPRRLRIHATRLFTRKDSNFLTVRGRRACDAESMLIPLGAACAALAYARRPTA